MALLSSSAQVDVSSSIVSGRKERFRKTEQGETEKGR